MGFEDRSIHKSLIGDKKLLAKRNIKTNNVSRD